MKGTAPFGDKLEQNYRRQFGKQKKGLQRKKGARETPENPQTMARAGKSKVHTSGKGETKKR